MHARSSGSAEQGVGHEGRSRGDPSSSYHTFYAAATREAVDHAQNFFGEPWGREYPMVVKGWKANQMTLSTVLDSPPEILRVIHKTNMVESLSAQLRKVVKKGAFPTPGSVRGVVNVMMTRASQRSSRPAKDRAEALDHMAVVFEGCLPL